MQDFYHITPTNGGFAVSCYGAIEDSSNFEIICEDEDDDDIWLVGNTDTNQPFKTWQEVVDFLDARYADIVEISAV
jgi:hypothetical protein